MNIKMFYFFTNINFFLRTDNDVFLIKTIDFELADSFAIWPHSLKTLTEAFSTQKQKLDIGEEIKHFDIHNIKHINYAFHARNDVDATV